MPPRTPKRGHSSGRKNIVMCFDGTTKQFGPEPFTNVLKLFRMLQTDTVALQVSYYQPGIGSSFVTDTTTLARKTFASCVLSKMDVTIDSFVAHTLDQHVKAAYTYLMRFYAPGDRIYLFGFSRGAFTARVLAGMIEGVGLLAGGLEHMVGTAWTTYRSWEEAGQPSQRGDLKTTLVEEFKHTFSRSAVTIHFMGLWDSVNSVGLLRDRMFPYTSRSNIVKHVRHAVSLDERRGKYKHNLVLQTGCNPPCSFTAPPGPLRLLVGYPASQTSTQYSFRLRFPGRGFRRKQDRAPPVASPDVVEMWFPGEHSDVGGGWRPTSEGQFLSNIPMRWMLFHAARFGVLFKPGSLRAFATRYPSGASLLAEHHDTLSLRIPSFGHQPGTCDRCFRARPPGAATPLIQPPKRVWPRWGCFSLTGSDRGDEELCSPLRCDAPEGTNQQAPCLNGCLLGYASRGECSLLLAWFWWLLELIPFGQNVEDEEGEWRTRLKPNFGKHRQPPPLLLCHWSVAYRQHLVCDYSPSALPPLVGYGTPNITDTDNETAPLPGGLRDYDFSVIPDDLATMLLYNPQL